MIIPHGHYINTFFLAHSFHLIIAHEVALITSKEKPGQLSHQFHPSSFSFLFFSFLFLLEINYDIFFFLFFFFLFFFFQIREKEREKNPREKLWLFSGGWDGTGDTSGNSRN